MLLYDAEAANPYALRLFILERGHLEFDVHSVDIANLENRRLAYRKVNPRGEVPALVLDDDTVLTEVTAICEYLDETATGGDSLYGSSAKERAETRMWLRRMDLEIAQPIIQYYRNDPDAIDFYKGNRLPIPEARVLQKVSINQYLNLLDDQMEDKDYLCGARFSAADIIFYGLIALMAYPCPWINSPGRKNVAAWWQRMSSREASAKAMTPFSGHIKV